MRLTFDIEDEDHEVLVRYIPHGMRKHCYYALIRGLVAELKKDPGPILHTLIDNSLDVIDLLKKGETDGSKERAAQHLGDGPRRAASTSYKGKGSAED